MSSSSSDNRPPRKRAAVARWILAPLTVGLVTGGLFLSLDSAGAAMKIQALEQRNERLRQENEHLRLINDLAIEFSMSPYTVELVDHYARQHVDPAQPEWRLVRNPEFMTYLMLSIIYAESKGNPAAIGDSGRARGLTQIWVSTAQQYGKVTAQDLLDPETNIKFAFEHFHYLLKRYRGNLALALYAWNRGPGTVDKLLIYGEAPSNGFGRKVYRAALDNSRRRLNLAD